MRFLILSSILFLLLSRGVGPAPGFVSLLGACAFFRGPCEGRERRDSIRETYLQLFDQKQLAWIRVRRQNAVRQIPRTSLNSAAVISPRLNFFWNKYPKKNFDSGLASNHHRHRSHFLIDCHVRPVAFPSCSLAASAIAPFYVQGIPASP